MTTRDMTQRLTQGFQLLSLFCSVTLLVDQGRGVKVAIKGGKSLYKMQATEGDRVSLLCTYTTQHPNSNKRIEWLLSNSTHQGIENHIVYDKVQSKFAGAFTLDGQATLVIEKALRTDSGIYRCVVTVPKDRPSISSARYNLSVVVKPTTPVCTYPPNNLMRIGKRSGFTCASADGYPKVQYVWFKDGKRLPHHYRLDPSYYNNSFLYHPHGGVLSFISVTSFDEGSYYCSAVNIAGRSSCPTTYVYAKLGNSSPIVTNSRAAFIFGLICTALLNFVTTPV